MRLIVNLVAVNVRCILGFDITIRNSKFPLKLSVGYFLEKNPKNNNATDSFYIRAPKEWSVERIFEVGDCVLDESEEFIESHGLDSELDMCGISVSKRY